jgi:tetratricopeptide (TPR) repeat protein
LGEPLPFSSGAAVPAPAKIPEADEAPSPRHDAVPIRKGLYLLLCVVAIVLMVAGALWWRSRSLPKLTDKDTVVVATLTNYSSDPVFDDALNLALKVELEQTPFLNILAPDKLRGALKSLKLPENSKLTPELARDVCLRSSSKAVIAASIGDLGNGYRLRLVGTDCRTGKTLSSVQMDAPGRSEIVKTLGVASAQLRREMGEPHASLKQFNQPLEEATSSSPDALQAFARARALRQQHGEIAKIISELEHAIELDPNYADAYLQLGISYLNAVETELSSQNVKKAYDLRNRVTEKQRLAIETFYYTQVTGQWDKSINSYTQLTRLYPRDPSGFLNLSANLLPLGQYERAAAAAQESLRLAPAAASYVNLMTAYNSLNRLEEARATYEEARAHNVDDPLLYLRRYDLAFLQRDFAAMQQLMASASDKPGLEQKLQCADSNAKAYYGRFREARILAERAVTAAKSGNRPLIAAQCLAAEALMEAEFGNLDRARQLATAALLLSTERGVQTGAALALARAGDLPGAEKIAANLNRQLPADLMMQNYLLPSIHAAIQLQQNNPGAAVTILQSSLPYEKGYDFYGGFGALYPAYLRGEAYRKLGNASAAEAEFRKLTDNPGIVSNFATGALAPLQIARVQAIKGDSTAAAQSYENFLASMKSADPDIPIVKQARSEQQQLSQPARKR